MSESRTREFTIEEYKEYLKASLNILLKAYNYDIFKGSAHSKQTQKIENEGVTTSITTHYGDVCNFNISFPCHVNDKMDFEDKFEKIKNQVLAGLNVFKEPLKVSHTIQTEKDKLKQDGIMIYKTRSESEDSVKVALVQTEGESPYHGTYMIGTLKSEGNNQQKMTCITYSELKEGYVTNVKGYYNWSLG